MKKTFFWNDEKNERLKMTRNISFEDIVLILEAEENFIKIISNPNQVKYPNQQAYIIRIK